MELTGGLVVNMLTIRWYCCIAGSVYSHRMDLLRLICLDKSGGNSNAEERISIMERVLN